MSKKALLAISIAVLIPLISYMILKKTSDNAVELPRHYLPDTVITKVVNGKIASDTQWHRVANIKLVNQLGDTVNLYDIHGTSIVLNFFFTSCASICPTLTRNMAKLQQSFLKGGDAMQPVDSPIVQFLSFTVDPERDSVARLKQYADHFGVNPDSWWLLTGSKDSIYNFAFEQLRVDKFETEPVDPNFVHTNRFVLLDKNYYVRGYYNGLDTASLSKLARDIGLLLLSKADNPEPLPFDPVLMAIFFAITVFVVVIVISILLRKNKSAAHNARYST